MTTTQQHPPTPATSGDGSTTTASDALGDTTTGSTSDALTETSAPPGDGEEDSGCATSGQPFAPTGTYTTADGEEVALEAGEIGITEDTITIGVYAAVDNPFVPGLAEGNRDAVSIWRDWVNQHCGLTGPSFGLDGHHHGEWRGAQHVDGERIADCSDPDTARRVHQIRDTVIRVDDPVGGGQSWGTMQPVVSGAFPDLGLSADDSFI